MEGNSKERKKERGRDDRRDKETLAQSHKTELHIQNDDRKVAK